MYAMQKLLKDRNVLILIESRNSAKVQSKLFHLLCQKSGRKLYILYKLLKNTLKKLYLYQKKFWFQLYFIIKIIPKLQEQWNSQIIIRLRLSAKIKLSNNKSDRVHIVSLNFQVQTLKSKKFRFIIITLVEHQE